MKRTKVTFLLLSTLILFVLCLTGGYMLKQYLPSALADETEEEENLDIVIISNEDYNRDRQGPVKLSHTRHAQEYGVSCWDCHHEYVDGKNTWSPLGDTYLCSECHDPMEVQDDAMRLQTAYHLNCKGCHKALALEGKKTGAHRKCLKCHEKKPS